MMDFLAKLFNPGGPMDLSTGKTAAPGAKDIMGGIGKGVGIANILADAIGGMPTYQAPPQPKNDLASLLKQLNLGQPQQQSPGDALMQRLFGLKPTNPVSPAMPPIQVNRQLPSAGIQGGTGGLY